jgi:4-amino-4-deoxy-L-arabinose transferase-like glycosyltransferase
MFDSRWVWAIAAAQLAVLLATSTRYGYHRDELYFIVAGGHAAFGYPDQPPLVPLLCWAMNALAPGSLLLLRAPSALAASATTLLSALIARDVGGGRQAQTIAAACTASSAFALAVSHLVTTTTFDMLSTTLLGWLAVRAVLCGEGPSLLAAGMVVGLGIEAKPQVGLVAAIMAGALLAVGPRRALRSRWTLAGVVAAVVLAAPYLIWQGAHDWPQATVASHVAGSEEGGRAGFLPFQLVMVSPLLVGVWLAGLLAPFRHERWRDLRFLPITYCALAVVYLLGDGKAYYLASLYPLLLGMGAIPTAQWVSRGRVHRLALTAAIVLSACISAFLALPLLPQRDLAGSVVVGVDSAQAETVGWPRFVSTVTRAWRAVPAAQRARTAIFTANYGEAGAIDVLGSRAQLPLAYSGHNGFSECGPPPARDRNVLLVGYEDPAEAAPHFVSCRTLARVDNGVGLDNQEQGLPVMLCRLEGSWAELWPRLRHYD